MLEKNKDYIEFNLQTSIINHRPYGHGTEISITGAVNGYDISLASLDIPCDVVVIPKRDFDRLQTDNEQLKKKLKEFSPIPEYKEFLMHLYSVEDAEKLEWVLRHVSGGMASTNEWIAISKFWKNNYAALSELVGFSSVEEIQDCLTNEAECDTLSEAVSKLKDQVKYTCDEWYSANSRNNSWKAAAECNSPKELIEKREALEKEIGIYSRTLNEWKEGTGCPSPSAAKTLIESGMSYVHGYHEAQEENRKLTEEVDSWKNTTGYATPEDYMHARISGAFHTPFDYTAAWQNATGCKSPNEAKEEMANFKRSAEGWENDYDELELDYRHLLALTGFDSEGEIEDFLEQNHDRNKLTTVIDNLKLEIEAMKTALRTSNLAMQKELDHEIDKWQKFTGCDSPQKAGCKINNLCDEICKLKGDYDHLLGLTGYKTEQDIRVALNYSEQFVYETMRELINSLKRNAKFIESNWQHATGCDAPGRAEEREKAWQDATGRIDPEAAKQYIDRLKARLLKIKEYVKVED